MANSVDIKVVGSNPQKHNSSVGILMAENNDETAASLPPDHLSHQSNLTIFS